MLRIFLHQFDPELCVSSRQQNHWILINQCIHIGSFWYWTHLTLLRISNTRIGFLVVLLILLFKHTSVLLIPIHFFLLLWNCKYVELLFDCFCIPLVWRSGSIWFYVAYCYAILINKIQIAGILNKFSLLQCSFGHGSIVIHCAQGITLAYQWLIN